MQSKFTTTAWRSTGDGVLSITNEPADNELSHETSLTYRDNRTGIALGSTVGSNLLNCEAERFGVSNSTPIVTWIKDGDLISSKTASSSSLDIASFTAADAGVYQCIFIDTDAAAEVITSIPFRLDSGFYYYNNIYMFVTIVSAYTNRYYCSFEWSTF